MKQIRVAIFPDNFAQYRIPGFQAISGIDGVDLVVYSPKESKRKGSVKPADEIARRENVGFSIMKNRHVYLGRFRVWTGGLLKVLFSKKYELVVCWGEAFNISTWIGLMLSRVTGQKIALWTHGVYGNEKAIKLIFRKVFYNLANTVFLYGDRSKELLMKSGLPPEKLFVIYNSLDYHRQKAVRESVSSEEIMDFRREILGGRSWHHLLMVGRITEFRRLEVAFEGIRLLKNRGIDCFFSVVGDGPMVEPYKDRSNVLGIGDRVVFYPATFDEAILARFFMSADLGVLPGAIGLFAVHAHSYGLPVCTHDALYTRHGPEVEVIRNGETGIFFREGDSEDFANKLEVWLKEFGRRGDHLREVCIGEVEKKYTPEKQRKVFLEALEYLSLLPD